MTVTLRPDGLPQPASEFDSAVVDLIADLFEAFPTWGTAAGYHVVDARFIARHDVGSWAAHLGPSAGLECDDPPIGDHQPSSLLGRILGRATSRRRDGG